MNPAEVAESLTQNQLRTLGLNNNQWQIDFVKQNCDQEIINTQVITLDTEIITKRALGIEKCDGLDFTSYVIPFARTAQNEKEEI